MSATQTGIKNSQSFLTTLKLSGDEQQYADVQALLKANDWQGVVDYARGFTYYNFSKNPFTADDVDVGLNPWMFVAVPEDYSNADLKGSFVAVRPYTGVGFCLLQKGGVAMVVDGSALKTDPASLNAGTPVGSPYNVPYQSGEKSPWILSQTSTGALAFFKNDQAYCVVVGPSQVWSRQNDAMKEPPLERSNGNLVPGGEGTANIGTDVKTAFVNYAAASWSVAATDVGNLAFRSQLNAANTPCMVALAASGWLGNGSGQRFGADDFHYSFAGLMDYFWAQGLAYAEMGLDWVADMATTSADWMENAAMDTWDWINDTANDAWNEIEDAWDDIESGLEDITDISNW